MFIYMSTHWWNLCFTLGIYFILRSVNIYIHRTLQRVQTQQEQGAKTKVIVTRPKSNCSIRTIQLNDEISKILASSQKSSPGYLLTNDDFKFIEPRTIQNKFKKVLKSAGIADANFHALRHSHASIFQSF